MRHDALHRLALRDGAPRVAEKDAHRLIAVKASTFGRNFIVATIKSMPCRNF
jgi:hypothetical protein